MLLFLSCSGERSKAVAETFSTWIRQVIQAVDPWISSDIDKGARWMEEVAAKLEEARVGIVCLTKENLKKEWILFETGAIAKMKDARACTLLVDIASADVEQPLSMFQDTPARDKKEVRKLLHTINKAVAKCGEKALDEPVLDCVFETNWPQLLGALDQIVSQQPSLVAVKSERPWPEMLQEILEILRGQERRVAEKRRGELGQEITQQDNLIRRLLEHNPASLGAALLGVAEPNAAFKEAIRRIQESSDQVKGALSSDLPNAYARVLGERYMARVITEMRAEDEKRAKGSQDEGEKDET